MLYLQEQRCRKWSEWFMAKQKKNNPYLHQW